MEISGFFCRSDFPWNQFQEFQISKNCRFNTFRSSKLWFLWIFEVSGGWIWPKSKIQRSKNGKKQHFLNFYSLQNWFHVKSWWQKNTYFSTLWNQYWMNEKLSSNLFDLFCFFKYWWLNSVILYPNFLDSLFTFSTFDEWFTKNSNLITVWKFQDFSITLILHEINFRDSRSAKPTILGLLWIFALIEGWNKAVFKNF